MRVLPGAGVVKLAQNIYLEWRQLRERTADHELRCDCEKCKKRRRLGGMIQLPYSGAPKEFKMAEDYVNRL